MLFFCVVVSVFPFLCVTPSPPAANTSQGPGLHFPFAVRGSSFLHPEPHRFPRVCRSRTAHLLPSNEFAFFPLTTPNRPSPILPVPFFSTLLFFFAPSAPFHPIFCKSQPFIDSSFNFPPPFVFSGGTVFFFLPPPPVLFLLFLLRFYGVLSCLATLRHHSLPPKGKPRSLSLGQVFWFPHTLHRVVFGFFPVFGEWWSIHRRPRLASSPILSCGSVFFFFSSSKGTPGISPVPCCGLLDQSFLKQFEPFSLNSSFFPCLAPYFPRSHQVAFCTFFPNITPMSGMFCESKGLPFNTSFWVLNPPLHSFHSLFHDFCLPFYAVCLRGATFCLFPMHHSCGAYPPLFAFRPLADRTQLPFNTGQLFFHLPARTSFPFVGPLSHVWVTFFLHSVFLVTLVPPFGVPVDWVAWTSFMLSFLLLPPGCSFSSVRLRHLVLKGDSFPVLFPFFGPSLVAPLPPTFKKKSCLISFNVLTFPSPF